MVPLVLAWALLSNEVCSQQLKPIPVSKNLAAPGLEFEEAPALPRNAAAASLPGVAEKKVLSPLIGPSASQILDQKSKSTSQSAEVSAASWMSEAAGLGLDDEFNSDGNYVQAVFELPNPNQPAKPAPTLEQVELAEQDLATGGLGNAIHGEDALKSGIEDQKSYFDSLRVEDFFQVATQPYRVYRGSEAKLTYLAGSSRAFGWTSMEWEPYLKREQANGLTGSIQHHFLSGPPTVDLPARLHDFIVGYQHRGTINGVFSFDCAATVGVFSDFKGSAREGVRFPAHAVGIIHASHRADLVFGVDYLDRDDYKILPVLGVSWHDLNFTSLRYDLVFPRPRIDYTIDDSKRIYLAGRLGGGTWDFELPDGSGDVMNFRDFRILGGLEQRYLDGSRQSLELGYVFGRQLTLRETSTEFDFRNAVIIRLQSTY